MSARALSTAGPRDAALELDADAEHLYAALSELVRVYQFRDRDRICCHDVSVTQCYALEALVRRGPSGLNELAADLFLDKSTASRVIATLTRKGYVTRVAHAEDRRAVVLSVTAAGRKLHARIRKDLVAEERALLADFEPEVRKAAPKLLLRLARAAMSRTSRGGTAACCPAPKAEK
jgi:MarR family transcriptional regulator, 2-MHQ and catechol-resistance regulon repressor